LKNSNFDKTIVAGHLGLGGTHKLGSGNGFVPQVGRHFDLPDWGSTDGSDDSIDASQPAAAAGRPGAGRFAAGSGRQHQRSGRARAGHVCADGVVHDFRGLSEAPQNATLRGGAPSASESPSTRQLRPPTGVHR
jgi:hypothetical protein